jgi:hypothetical protein
MSRDETTAQRLTRWVAVHLSTMQSWGADYNYQYLTMTRLEVQFKDGETIVISFATKGAKGK